MNNENFSENFCWSFSRLSSFEKCKHAFYLKYKKGIEPVPTQAMIRGKERHLFLEKNIRVYKGMKGYDELRREDLKALKKVQENFVKRDNKFIKTEIQLEVDRLGKKVKPGTGKGWLTGILDAVIMHSRSRFPRKLIPCPTGEQGKMVEVEEGGGGQTILEYKTGNSNYFSKQQVELYAVLARLVFNWGMDTRVVVIFPYNKYQNFTFLFSDKELDMKWEQLREKLIFFESKIFDSRGKWLGEEEFPPTISACQGCLFWNKCKYFYV